MEAARCHRRQRSAWSVAAVFASSEVGCRRPRGRETEAWRREKRLLLWMFSGFSVFCLLLEISVTIGHSYM